MQFLVNNRYEGIQSLAVAIPPALQQRRNLARRLVPHETPLRKGKRLASKTSRGCFGCQPELIEKLATYGLFTQAKNILEHTNDKICREYALLRGRGQNVSRDESS